MTAVLLRRPHTRRYPPHRCPDIHKFYDDIMMFSTLKSQFCFFNNEMVSFKLAAVVSHIKDKFFKIFWKYESH